MLTPALFYRIPEDLRECQLCDDTPSIITKPRFPLISAVVSFPKMILPSTSLFLPRRCALFSWPLLSPSKSLHHPHPFSNISPVQNWMPASSRTSPHRLRPQSPRATPRACLIIRVHHCRRHVVVNRDPSRRFVSAGTRCKRSTCGRSNRASAPPPSPRCSRPFGWRMCSRRQRERRMRWTHRSRATEHGTNAGFLLRATHLSPSRNYSRR